jgi:hypothetical protein
MYQGKKQSKELQKRLMENPRSFVLLRMTRESVTLSDSEESLEFANDSQKIRFALDGRCFHPSSG